MKIKKITTGFVIQTFDTEKQEFIEQEFVAGDTVDVEDETGNPIEDQEITGIDEKYLPFEMVQPNELDLIYSNR